MEIKNGVTSLIVLLLMFQAVISLDSLQSNMRTHRKDKSSRKKSKSGTKDNIETDQPRILEVQGFPEVSYPTSIFEASQPYFYKTNTYDEVLAPFPEDVQSSYKSVSSNIKNPTSKVSSPVYEVKKDINSNSVSLPIEPPEPIYIPNEESVLLRPVDFLTDTSFNGSNETTLNNIILPKESLYFDIIYKNASTVENPIIELGPPSVPVRLKINIEIFKDEMVEEYYNQTIPCLEQNDTTNFNESEITEVTNYDISDIDSVPEEHITVLDEINDDDFVNALSILLLDSLNNRPIELPLSELTDLENNINASLSILDGIIVETCANSTNNTNSSSSTEILEPVQESATNTDSSDEPIKELENKHEEIYVFDSNFDDQSTNSTEIFHIDKETKYLDEIKLENVNNITVV